MTDPQLLTRRTMRSRPLVTGAVLAGVGAVLGLTGIALAAVAALSVLREGMDPDVLIASYSGLTQEEYDAVTAAGIPVVAPEDALWSTPWRDVITDTSGYCIADT